MSIACPYCKTGLAPKGLKPGKYTPKCPKCGNPFLLLVPEDEGGTISVQQLVQKKPPVDPKAPTERLPAEASRPPTKAAPPDVDTDKIRKLGPKPPKKPMSVEDAAAALLEGKGPGDITDLDSPDPNATGDFTEPDDAKPADPGATGDFTEDVAEKPAVLKPEKQTKPKAEAPAALDEDVPPQLGGYEVLKVLGRGGMGAVLLGRQISLDRPVALKIMHPKIAQNPAFVARFTREAYAAAQLTHHNVVQIYDIGEEHGRHFFSMEFVEGQSLMELVRKEGKLPADVAVGYILQAARGLRYGHNQGMIHRDIKPDNLMINTEGLVKVADLGLVKLGNAELGTRNEETEPVESSIPHSEFRDPNLTGAGAVMGTPAYMSPEQSRDSAGVDARADIYSLGCTLYVLVTGRTPFEGKTALEIISKHQTEPMTPPEVVVKRVPKALSAIVLKMTAKKPDDRHQSMDDVIAALESFLGPEKSGTFNPKEEQADRLEKCAHQFNFRSKAGLKKSLSLAFFAVCLLGIAGAAFAGMPALAGGLLGLMVMAPLAYFVIHGTLTGGVVFPKARAVVFGVRFFDWLMWIGGGLLFLATLFLFGLLWSWLGFALLAVALGFVLWFLTDRSAAKAQEASLEDARGLFKSLRLSGLDEEQLRQFVCKFSGSNWEPFYEALFGYEAKVAARAYRKGDTGEVWKKHGTWREPVLAWLDARLEARRLARERKHLQKVEAKALEAEGASKSEAKAQAAAMAADLVDRAAEAKAAGKEGKEASVLALLRAARERKKPKPGFNLAGKPLRDLWFKDFVNEWFGRRLRFLLGAAVFAVGLFWMYQNDLFGKTNVFKQLLAADFDGAQKSLAKATGKFPAPDFVPVPTEVLKPLASVNVPALGLLLMLSGIFHFGWRPTLVALPGLVLGIAGPMFGVPELGPLSAEVVCLIAGGVMILGIGWLVRQ